MNLLERVLTLLRANLNVVVENADDPEKALKQLHLDMRNQLVQVKTQVATAIAEGIKLQKRQQECEAAAESWLHKAEQAVQQHNDEAARDALVHYNDLTRQAEHFLNLKQNQDRLVSMLRSALRQLEGKIVEVQTTLETLETRKRNALIQQRVLEALNKQRESGVEGTPSPTSPSEGEIRMRARAQRQQQASNPRPKTTANLEQQLQQLRKRSAEPTTNLEMPKEEPTTLSPRRTTDQLAASQPAPPRLLNSGELDLEKLKKLLNTEQG
ncbi:PspA/IM30 family protein [Ktedonobacter racemifer]|uniref:Phage shock protein A, PspA n=1 Tax=Ktedonobacter racemifer DSM 44963 TaxID=485913 RepID=D6TJP4_KTERA|nr:PspA/IM30 family protein [Ktedonobacter racemifer]EFH89651.1 phage shock protein A, PspA [Ktedonobacter racemifer DSM 44963]